MVAYSYITFVSIIVVGSLLVAFFVKKKIIDSGGLADGNAYEVDWLLLLQIGLFSLTLWGTVIYFKVLDRRYKMSIKKY